MKTPIRITPLLVALTVLVAGACSSSKKQPPEMQQDSPLDSISLIQVEKPTGNKKIRITPVYVDQIQKLSTGETAGLLIKGNLPNGCAKLMNVQHHLRTETVELTLESWQSRDAVCTQALVPFNHYYTAIPRDSLDRITRVQVGDHTFTLE